VFTAHDCCSGTARFGLLFLAFCLLFACGALSAGKDHTVRFSLISVTSPSTQFNNIGSVILSRRSFRDGDGSSANFPSLVSNETFWEREQLLRVNPPSVGGKEGFTGFTLRADL